MPADEEVTAPEVGRRVDRLERGIYEALAEIKSALTGMQSQFVTHPEHRALVDDVTEIKTGTERYRDRQRQLVLWVVASFVVPVLVLPCVGIFGGVFTGVAVYVLTHP